MSTLLLYYSEGRLYFLLDISILIDTLGPFVYLLAVPSTFPLESPKISPPPTLPRESNEAPALRRGRESSSSVTVAGDPPLSDKRTVSHRGDGSRWLLCHHAAKNRFVRIRAAIARSCATRPLRRDVTIRGIFMALFRRGYERFISAALPASDRANLWKSWMHIG